MKLNELRKFVSCVLLERDLSQFKFIGDDTLKLLQQFVWRAAADVVKQKSGNSVRGSAGGGSTQDKNYFSAGSNKTSTGDLDPQEVKQVATDLEDSMQNHLVDLLQHYGVADAPKKAPPSSSGKKSDLSTPGAKKPASKEPSFPKVAKPLTFDKDLSNT